MQIYGMQQQLLLCHNQVMYSPYEIKKMQWFYEKSLKIMSVIGLNQKCLEFS